MLVLEIGDDEMDSKYVKEKMYYSEIKEKKNLSRPIIILVFGLIFSFIFFFAYQTSSIEGKWTSVSNNPFLLKEFTKMKSSTKELHSISFSNSMTNPEVELTVNDDTFNMFYQVSINKKALINQIQTYAKSETAKLLTPENQGQRVLPTEVKREVLEQLPTGKETEETIDIILSEKAHQVGGKYDKKTGSLTFMVMSGKVNRFSNTIDLKKDASQSKKQSFKGDKACFDYMRDGQQLILEGDKSLVFKRQK